MRYLLFLLIFCAGCATIKPQVVYFNDDERIYSDEAKTGVCSNVDFPCVVMSKGKFRELTTINNMP